MVILDAVQTPLEAKFEDGSSDLVHAAVAHSSIGIAICDHDFIVRFFNPAIAKLIDRCADAPRDAMDGLTLIRSLGVAAAPARAEAGARGGWQAVAACGKSDGLEPSHEMHVTVEAFRDASRAPGWLIIAREHARPATAGLTEHQLVALAGKFTPRERDVMLALQVGASNKAIALRLGISPRTVEFHRARIMQRFAARSVVELVRKVTSEIQATTYAAAAS